MILRHRDKELIRFEWISSDRVRGDSVDNGYGLFSLMALPEKFAVDDIRPVQAYLRDKHPALLDHWLGFSSVSTLNLAECVARLKGFRFRRHRHYNLPAERLALIERFLQKRVDDILRHFEDADKYLKIAPKDVGVNSKNKKRGVGVNQIDGIDVAALEGDPLALQILWNLKANSLMTQAELARVLGRDSRTVERKVKKLREAKLLRRVGSDKSGSWEVSIAMS